VYGVLAEFRGSTSKLIQDYIVLRFSLHTYTRNPCACVFLIRSIASYSLCIACCAGILEQSMRPRNRVGIELSYRPARALFCRSFKEPRDRFPAWWAGTTTLFVLPARQAIARGIDFSESILGLLKRLQIRAQAIKGWRNRFLGSLKALKYRLCILYLVGFYATGKTNLSAF
jgi:hypothetical protein